MAENKDLYNILGISKDASDNEIKSAYRKQALRYHPDRQAGKSEKDKKEAEDKFKEISRAYSILSDPEKRRRYDQYGITDDQQAGGFDSGFDAGDIFQDFMSRFGFGGDDDGFGGFFNRHRNTTHQPRQERGKTVQMQMPVDIKDILNGIDKDVKYDIQARCGRCHGTGGDGVETCQHCHGTGMMTTVQRTQFGMIQQSRPCPYCNSTGQTIKHKCDHCNGTGFEIKEETVHVKVDPGFENGMMIKFAGKGYECKDKMSANGDLLIYLTYNIDQSHWAISDTNIFEVIDVPYYDCILGTKLNHKLPNGDQIEINIPQYCQDKQQIDTTKKYGNKRYSAFINVKMPTYIKKSEKELLVKIKKENG